MRQLETGDHGVKMCYKMQMRTFRGLSLLFHTSGEYTVMLFSCEMCIHTSHWAF